MRFRSDLERKRLGPVTVLIFTTAFQGTTAARPITEGWASAQAGQANSQVREYKFTTPISDQGLKVIAINNLRNETWVRDLEIKVKNTSGKQIYYIRMWVILPEVFIKLNAPFGFQMEYGRSDLSGLKVAANNDESLAREGEYTFKLTEKHNQVWADILERKLYPVTDVTRIEIFVAEVGFGDGTGNIGGLWIPPESKPQ